MESELLKQISCRRGVVSSSVLVSIFPFHTVQLSRNRFTRDSFGQKKDHLLRDGLFGCVIIIVAATYFTGFDPSIIGGSGLNFSVRDGKR